MSKPDGVYHDYIVHPYTQHAIEHVLKALPQAVLLEGHEGQGKTHLAEALAADILGIETAALSSYPYIRRLTVEKTSIPIEQVRALQGFFSLKIPGGRTKKRIVLIPDAELLALPAQNALLKLLEEPPLDTVLILTSSRPHKLLATIRSRLQSITVHAPDHAHVRQYLSAAYDKSAVLQAEKLTDGSISAIVRMLDTTSGQATLLDDVKAFLGAKTFERLIIAEQFIKSREQAIAFVELLAHVASSSLKSVANGSETSKVRWSKIYAASGMAATNLAKQANVRLTILKLCLEI